MAGTGGSGGAQINVVPLIDIVLVLLIIFMVVTPMLQKGVDVKLPKATNVVKKDERTARGSQKLVGDRLGSRNDARDVRIDAGLTRHARVGLLAPELLFLRLVSLLVEPSAFFLSFLKCRVRRHARETP